MTNIYNKIRDQSRDDSRRFAKGILCKIVYQKKALNLIDKYGLLPTNIRFNNSYIVDGVVVSYMDTTAGKFFAIPMNSYAKYLKELKKISEVTLEQRKKEATNRQSDLDLLVELEVLDFLKQILVLITVPKYRWPEGQINLNPEQYDVIVDTLDIGQTMDCVFVRAAGKNADPPRKF